jgi:SAM-dependent methyltransferase
MTIQAAPGLTEVKQRARASWAVGDFPAVAKLQLWVVGERLVRRVGIGRDENALDIACGTGNAALRAAAAGGRVVGVDLTPELFIAGRALAAEAGVKIQWVEGDAEELPFEDERFDVVLSTFGVMCVYCDRGTFRVHQLEPGGDPGRLLPDDGRVRPARPAVRATPVVVGHREPCPAHLRGHRGHARVRPRVGPAAAVRHARRGGGLECGEVRSAADAARSPRAARPVGRGAGEDDFDLRQRRPSGVPGGPGAKGRLSDQCIFGPRCGPTFRRSTLAAMTRPTPWDPSRERRRCHWHDAAQMAVVWPRCGPVEGVGRGRANGAGGH